MEALKIQETEEVEFSVLNSLKRMGLVLGGIVSIMSARDIISNRIELSAALSGVLGPGHVEKFISSVAPEAVGITITVVGALALMKAGQLSSLKRK